MTRTLSMCLVAGALVGAGLLIAGASTLRGEQPAAPPAGTAGVEAAGFVGKTAMLDSTGYSSTGASSRRARTTSRGTRTRRVSWCLPNPDMTGYRSRADVP